MSDLSRPVNLSGPMRPALLLGLLLLAPTAPAHADWKAERALAIANTVWRVQCAEPVQIVLFHEPSWTGGHASAEPCASHISINTASPYWNEWPKFCSNVLHEMGHVAGYRDPATGDVHSTKPRSIMRAVQFRSRGTDDRTGLVTWEGVDRRCRRNGRPYLERHGLLEPIARRNR